MAKKIIKEVRLTFNEKDRDIVEYLNGKTSKVGFIKDLIRREMWHDECYISCGYSVTMNEVSHETNEPKDKASDEFDFDLSDLM